MLTHPAFQIPHAQHAHTQLLGHALGLTTPHNVIMAANSRVDSDSESNLSGHSSSKRMNLNAAVYFISVKWVYIWQLV